jgi:hypothetical protein
MLALIVLAGMLAASELDPANALTWHIGAGFVSMLAAIAILYTRMQARQSQLVTG